MTDTPERAMKPGEVTLRAYYAKRGPAGLDPDMLGDDGDMDAWAAAERKARMSGALFEAVKRWVESRDDTGMSEAADAECDLWNAFDDALATMEQEQ